MANLDPWAYAAKTRNEHAEQVALFMWANMAMRFGLKASFDPRSYNEAGYALIMFDMHGGEIPQLKWLHAIPNQGHGDAIRGGKAKAEGVKAGVADIFLPVPMVATSTAGSFNCAGKYRIPRCAGFYIELKRLDSKDKPKGRPSEVQLEFQTDMRAAGYKHEVIYGWELARDAILGYLGRA